MHPAKKTLGTFKFTTTSLNDNALILAALVLKDFFFFADHYHFKNVILILLDKNLAMHLISFLIVRQQIFCCKFVRISTDMKQQIAG